MLFTKSSSEASDWPLTLEPLPLALMSLDHPMSSLSLHPVDPSSLLHAFVPRHINLWILLATFGKACGPIYHYFNLVQPLYVHHRMIQ